MHLEEKQQKKQSRVYTKKSTRLGGKQFAPLQDLCEFNEALSQLQSPTGNEADKEALQSYVAWCTKCPKHWNSIATAWGSAGVHLNQVLTWLSTLRQQGKIHLSAKTLLGKFSQLRAGLHHFASSDLPSWAIRYDKIPKAIRDQMAAWEAQDLHKGTKPPSRRHLFLTGAQVESFCFQQVFKDILLPGGATDQDILHALVLRVQSGTNLRSGNLRCDTHWNRLLDKIHPGCQNVLILVNVSIPLGGMFLGSSPQVHPSL